MLKELREKERTPFNEKLIQIAKRRLARRIGLEAFRGMTREEIVLRLSLDHEDLEDVLRIGQEEKLLEIRGELVFKYQETLG